MNNEIPDRAFALDGFDAAGDPILEDIGPCETVNCGRGSKQSQVNLRVSRGFTLPQCAPRRDRRDFQLVQREEAWRVHDAPVHGARTLT